MAENLEKLSPSAARLLFGNWYASNEEDKETIQNASDETILRWQDEFINSGHALVTDGKVLGFATDGQGNDYIKSEISKRAATEKTEQQRREIDSLFGQGAEINETMREVHSLVANSDNGTDSVESKIKQLVKATDSKEEKEKLPESVQNQIDNLSSKGKSLLTVMSDNTTTETDNTSTSGDSTDVPYDIPTAPWITTPEFVKKIISIFDTPANQLISILPDNSTSDNITSTDNATVVSDDSTSDTSTTTVQPVPDILHEPTANLRELGAWNDIVTFFETPADKIDWSGIGDVVFDSLVGNTRYTDSFVQPGTYVDDGLGEEIANNILEFAESQANQDPFSEETVGGFPEETVDTSTGFPREPLTDNPLADLHNQGEGGAIPNFDPTVLEEQDPGEFDTTITDAQTGNSTTDTRGDEPDMSGETGVAWQDPKVAGPDGLKETQQINDAANRQATLAAQSAMDTSSSVQLNYPPPPSTSRYTKEDIFGNQPEAIETKPFEQQTNKPFSITSFRKRMKGTSYTNRFYFYFPDRINVLNYIYKDQVDREMEELFENIFFYSRDMTIPARGFETNGAFHYANGFRVETPRSFRYGDGDITITLRMDRKYLMYKFFNDWMNKIQNQRTGFLDFYNSYTTDIQVYQIPASTVEILETGLFENSIESHILENSEISKGHYQFDLIKCYPRSIDTINFNHDAAEMVEIKVKFTYSGVVFDDDSRYEANQKALEDSILAEQQATGPIGAATLALGDAAIRRETINTLSAGPSGDSVPATSVDSPDPLDNISTKTPEQLAQELEFSKIDPSLFTPSQGAANLAYPVGEVEITDEVRNIIATSGVLPIAEQADAAIAQRLSEDSSAVQQMFAGVWSNRPSEIRDQTTQALTMIEMMKEAQRQSNKLNEYDGSNPQYDIPEFTVTETRLVDTSEPQYDHYENLGRDGELVEETNFEEVLNAYVTMYENESILLEEVDYSDISENIDRSLDTFAVENLDFDSESFRFYDGSWHTSHSPTEESDASLPHVLAPLSSSPNPTLEEIRAADMSASVLERRIYLNKETQNENEKKMDTIRGQLTIYDRLLGDMVPSDPTRNEVKKIIDITEMQITNLVGKNEQLTQENKSLSNDVNAYLSYANSSIAVSPKGNVVETLESERRQTLIVEVFDIDDMLPEKDSSDLNALESARQAFDLAEVENNPYGMMRAQMNIDHYFRNHPDKADAFSNMVSSDEYTRYQKAIADEQATQTEIEAAKFALREKVEKEIEAADQKEAERKAEEEAQEQNKYD